MKKVTIEIPEGKIARQKEVNGETIVELVDDDRSVIERVKTFSDALREVGIKESEKEWEKHYSNLENGVVAYMKLRIISKALNEGWEPEFKDDEYFYHPCFKIQELRKMRYFHLKLPAIVNITYGVVISYSNVCHHKKNRLVLRTEELAEYAGKQFIGIWTDYILG